RLLFGVSLLFSVYYLLLSVVFHHFFVPSTHSFGNPPPSPPSFLFSKVWKFAPLPIIIEVLDLFTYWRRTNEACLFLFKTIQNSDYRCLHINFYLTDYGTAASFLSGKNDQ